GRAWSNLLVNIILALRENNEKVRGAHPEQIYHLSATYLLKSLDDNALYTDPVTAEKDREGYNSTGAGFTYRHVEGGIQVLSIIRNSPAFFSPLAEGDVITHINSKKVAEITPELLEATLISNNTAILHFNYITYIMNQPAEAYIRKDKIIMPSVTADASVPGIPVVAIRDFRQGAARELKAAIDGLDRASMKGLVIDLRAATGGEFSEAMEAANLFIDGGELLKTKRHDGRGGSLYSAKEGDMLSGLPVAVIADNSTKGYPEAFAFALAERKRAVLLGTPTFGMGTVEETFDINKNRKATFATSLVFSPEGAALNGIGVAPLVCLSSFKATGDADKFVRNAKAGRFKDNRMKLAEPTKDDIETLRKSCPAVYPTMEMQALPITIAAKILEDKEAYGKLADMM
ncbi:MAG: hypothetical protein LBO78_01700, partial [Rickettsiales bacterium]|nr:hypothetical protein [Rickettsiales bacterium]